MNVDKIKTSNGVVYVASCDEALSDESVARLRERLQSTLGPSVIVLDNGIRLSQIRLVPDMMGDIVEFHRKFGIEYGGKPRPLDPTLLSFRQKFMEEELGEYFIATEKLMHETYLKVGEVDHGMVTIQLEKALDALVDLVYVALGTAHLHGFNFNEAWRRVHEANMKKIRAPNAKASAESTGRGHAFDVIKPEGWVAPSHSDLVEDHEHQEMTNG